MIRKICSFLVALVMAFSCTINVCASTVEEVEASEIVVNETGLSFYDNCVVENVNVILRGETINVRRTIYSDNQMVIDITENGVTKSISTNCDYLQLRNMLEYDANRDSEVSTFERHEGYTYTYLKTDTQSYWYTPDAMTYYDIFNDLSALFCELAWFKLATISTLAAIIAANSYAEVNTRIDVTQYWYEEKASGQFVSYLCEYVATVYVETSPGSYTYADHTSGDYNTLYL